MQASNACWSLRPIAKRDATSARARGTPACASSRKIASHVACVSSAARAARRRVLVSATGDSVRDAVVRGIVAARRRRGIDFDKKRPEF